MEEILYIKYPLEVAMFSSRWMAEVLLDEPFLAIMASPILVDCAHIDP